MPEIPDIYFKTSSLTGWLADCEGWPCQLRNQTLPTSMNCDLLVLYKWISWLLPLGRDRDRDYSVFNTLSTDVLLETVQCDGNIHLPRLSYRLLDVYNYTQACIPTQQEYSCIILDTCNVELVSVHYTGCFIKTPTHRLCQIKKHILCTEDGWLTPQC